MAGILATLVLLFGITTGINAQGEHWGWASFTAVMMLGMVIGFFSTWPRVETFHAQDGESIEDAFKRAMDRRPDHTVVRKPDESEEEDDDADE